MHHNAELLSIAAAALILLLSAMAGGALWLALGAGRRYAVTPPVERTVTRPKGKANLRIHAIPETLVGRATGLLALGAVVVSALAALAAYVYDSVLEGDGIAAVDKPAVAWLADHRQPVLTAVMRAVSTIGSPACAAVIAILLCGLVAWRVGRWLPAVVAALGMAGYALIDTVLKLVVHRQRPPLPYAVVTAHGYSFPSGHAMGVATSALISAWALGHWILRSKATRIAIWTSAIAIILGVGFSRVYLGVHYPTDVIAGWALGAMWASVVIMFAAVAEQSSGTRSAMPHGHEFGHDHRPRGQP